jgi:hypothetical protein
MKLPFALVAEKCIVNFIIGHTLSFTPSKAYIAGGFNDFLNTISPYASCAGNLPSRHVFSQKLNNEFGSNFARHDWSFLRIIDDT